MAVDPISGQDLPSTETVVHVPTIREIGVPLSTEPRRVNAEIQLHALTQRLVEVERERDRLLAETEHLGRLKTEVERLRAERASEDLRREVEGARSGLAKKDQEIAKLKDALSQSQESEKAALARAQAAEQKLADRAASLQHSLEAMQRARDTAQRAEAAKEAERLAAIKAHVDASDRARKADARVAPLESIKAAAEKVVAVLPKGLKELREVRVLSALLKPAPQQQPVKKK